MESKTVPQGRYDEFVDAIKGIGIMLVVIGHSGFAYRNIIYLFHMALFFIVSGYCYKEKELTLGAWMTKKLRSLWVPNFVSVLILSLMSNILLDLHVISVDAYNPLTIMNFIKTFVKATLFSGGSQLLGANWFLRTMFLGLFLYEITNRLLKYIRKDIWYLRLVICILYLVIGYLLTEQLGYGMYFNVLSVPILLDIGRYIKDRDMVKRFRYRKLFSGISGMVLLICLIFLSHFGSISMNYNVIVNPVFFLLCSVAGFFLCASITDLVVRCGYGIKKIIVYMGHNSLIIMLLHFISFKVVTLFQIVIFDDSIEKLVSHPVYISSNGWWAVYSIVGMAIPCLFAFVWKKCRNKLVEIVKLCVKRFKNMKQ